MDHFLDTYHLPKLNYDQISNLNRPITPSEIKAVIKISRPEKKKPALDSFSTEFYHTFKEELTPILFGVIPQNRKRKNMAQFIL